MSIPNFISIYITEQRLSKFLFNSNLKSLKSTSYNIKTQLPLLFLMLRLLYAFTTVFTCTLDQIPH